MTGRKFTAVFAANDWMAIGLIQGLRAKGIDVPDRYPCSVWTNIPLASQFSPALTTYSLDANIMIAECFSQMEEAEREMQTHPCDRKICRRIILQPVLITRDTLRKIGSPEDPDGH